MTDKIKVGAVSYLNTKPLLLGFEQLQWTGEIEFKLDYPSRLAQQLKQDEIDIALMPVAAMLDIPGTTIISDYGIAADGVVASVCIYSHVPLQEVNTVLLDYQSRTSVRLAQLLLKEYWQHEVVFQQADEQYINDIKGNTAGVIIGDRALQQLGNFPYVYDLAAAWKAWTGLPFVFAAWISKKSWSPEFIHFFNQANKFGLQHLDTLVTQIAYPHYDLNQYYTENIHYHLDAMKREGLALFLQKIK